MSTSLVTSSMHIFSSFATEETFGLGEGNISSWSTKLTETDDEREGLTVLLDCCCTDGFGARLMDMTSFPMMPLRFRLASINLFCCLRWTPSLKRCGCWGMEEACLNTCPGWKLWIQVFSLLDIISRRYIRTCRMRLVRQQLCFGPTSMEMLLLHRSHAPVLISNICQVTWSHDKGMEERIISLRILNSLFDLQMAICV